MTMPPKNNCWSDNHHHSDDSNSDDSNDDRQQHQHRSAGSAMTAGTGSSGGAKGAASSRAATAMSAMPSLSSSSSSSAAGAFVLEAADLVPSIALSSSSSQIFDQLLRGFQKEFIEDVWQLEYLDSTQWDRLGVPMGLVAAIRKCLQERKNLNQQQQRQQPTPKQSHEKKKKQQQQQHKQNHHHHHHTDKRRLSPIRGSKLERTSAKVILTHELLTIPSKDNAFESQVSAITIPADLDRTSSITPTRSITRYYNNSNNNNTRTSCNTSTQPKKKSLSMISMNQYPMALSPTLTNTTTSATVTDTGSMPPKTSLLSSASEGAPMTPPMSISEQRRNRNSNRHPSNARSKSPLLISQQDESVDTFFPPTMPERKKSHDVPVSWLGSMDSSSKLLDNTDNNNNNNRRLGGSPIHIIETPEDHWTCASETYNLNGIGGSGAAKEIKLPPVLPTRLESDEPAASHYSNSSTTNGGDESCGDDDDNSNKNHQNEDTTAAVAAVNTDKEDVATPSIPNTTAAATNGSSSMAGTAALQQPSQPQPICCE